MNQRVVITGMGTLSSAGSNLETTRATFVSGTCCLSPIADPRLKHLKARYAGLVTDFDPAGASLPPELRSADRHAQMAFVAAREALAGAGVQPPDFGRRLGLIFSTCSGPMLLIERHYERIVAGNPRLSPDELFAKKYYSGAQILAAALGIQGYSTTVLTACTAGTGAIALAADLIRCGFLDAALAGGADAFATSTLAGFDGLKATTDGKCAPFSKPYGLNLGEAAAFVFLETLASARQCGRRIRAELLGSGLSNDAFHCSAPEPTGRGLVLAMQRALADAGVGPEAISYINAHGTGTEANDKAETRAIRKVFGPLAERVPLSSTKSMVGHCLGAAGAIELVASILCAEAGVLPPTANFTQPREGCTLDYVPDPGRKWPRPRTFLSSNLAFGGHNASLVLAMPDADHPPASASAASAPPIGEPLWLTACGVVSCAGLGVSAVMEARQSRAPKFRSVNLPGVGSLRAGMIDEALIERSERRLDLRHFDRSSRWATVAARIALREAAFPDSPSALTELGLFLDLATGPSWAEAEFLTSFLRHDRQVSQVAAFPYIVPSSVAGNVCRALRLTGHNLTLSCGPGAGLLGLGPAVAALRRGHTEALLTGAVDELSERILADNFFARRIPEGATPPGEGAAIFLLETARHARARQAQPLAVLRGLAFSTAASADACSSSLPPLLRQTVLDALAQAQVDRAQVSALCLQDNSPQLIAELAAICPGWADRLVDVSPFTGQSEAAQVLFNLAAAFQSSTEKPSDARLILAVTASAENGCAAVVLEPAQGIA